MLRLILCCLLLVIASGGTFAAPPQYAFRITFTDKAGSPPLSAQPAWLSARAIARRAAAGIALDSTDRPVSPVYIDSVLHLTQGRLHNTSRWLNQCVVLLEDSTGILQLAGRRFISNVAWVGYFSNGLHMRMVPGSAGDQKYALEQAVTAPVFAKGTGTAAYYGAAYPQTAIVNGDYLHDLGYRGEGRLIAVLDQGFEATDTHSGFDSLRQQGRILETYDFVHDATGIYASGSEHQHGTSCLSTMAGLAPGTYVGSAPKAQYALYITEDLDFRDALYELDNLIAGMERADSIGADVISCSLGYNTFSSPYTAAYSNSELTGFGTIVARAVNLAVAKGIFYVSSAGNEAFILTPSDADSALTVGSVDVNKNPSGFSSPGPNASGRVKPDVCLLGGPAAVFVAGNGIVSSPGTSFSAPQAAGYAACLMQAFPGATPYRIRQAISRSADHFTTPTPQLGYGVPDFRRVFQYLSIDTVPGGESNIIIVQPNPFVQEIMAGIPAGAIVTDAALYDAVGRRLQVRQSRTGALLGLATPYMLPAGIYFLKLEIDGRPFVAKLMHD